VLCGLSYLWAAVKPKGREDNLEQWVSNRFGKRLYGHFFKSYTEKVWGVPATEVRAEWAAQRIKGLSFFSAAKAAFFGNKGNIKTLIDKFQYPRYGPGQMWEKMTARIEEMGGEVRLNTPVDKIELDAEPRQALHTADEVIEPKAVISSLPLRDTVAWPTRPRRPTSARPARRCATATSSRSRWSSTARTRSRTTGSTSTSPTSRSAASRTSAPGARGWSRPGHELRRPGVLLLPGRPLWTMADEDLVALATRELEQLGLCKPGSVKRGYAVRVPLAYPMYDETYAEQVATIRSWLDPIKGLVQVGRNGLHRYNNSDHSMLSAMRAVDNVLGRGEHDIWAVNVESAYHEEETDADAEHAYKKVPLTPAAEAEERAMAEAPSPTRSGVLRLRGRRAAARAGPAEGPPARRRGEAAHAPLR
jgi:protoporphyrinogen oxidase